MVQTRRWAYANGSNSRLMFDPQPRQGIATVADSQVQS